MSKIEDVIQAIQHPDLEELLGDDGVSISCPKCGTRFIAKTKDVVCPNCGDSIRVHFNIK